MQELRNIGTDDVSLYQPDSDPHVVIVISGGTVDAMGDLAVDQPYADAILIDSNNGELRAWPTSRWSLP